MTNDDAAFTELYRSTHEQVGRYCLRRLPPDDARDALTETFLTAWRRFSDVPSGDDALPWLYGVARNVVRNRARTSRRATRLTARLGREPLRIAPDPAHQVIRNEEDQAFLAIVDDLPERDREIVRLRAFEQLDYDQIALVLGCSNGAARQRLSRALKRLEARLDEAAQSTPRASQKGGNRRVG